VKLATVLLRDKDRRRCRWMVRRAALQDAHRKILAAIDDKTKLSAEDRTFVRTFFDLYKPGPVDAHTEAP